MGIFRRDHGDVQQTSAAPYPETGATGSQLEQQAMLMPPFMPAPDGAAAPGVVPPPAAPIYSMRPPESATRADGSADGLAADSMRMASTVAAPATRARRPLTRRPARPVQQIPFDPTRCAQAGLLKLAWRWQQAGAPIRAIHTYMQLLDRYPHTPAAAAAVADLVELSEDLARHGHFHVALGIYEELEELL